MVKRFSHCFTPELVRHFESHNEKVARWLETHKRATLKLPVRAGPIFLSNYEGADSFSVEQATIEGLMALRHSKGLPGVALELLVAGLGVTGLHLLLLRGQGLVGGVGERGGQARDGQERCDDGVRRVLLSGVGTRVDGAHDRRGRRSPDHVIRPQQERRRDREARGSWRSSC
jgi:hypothetical protein